MSYHNNIATGKPIEIEMPPLPVEAAPVEQPVVQEQEQPEPTIEAQEQETETVDNLSTLAEPVEQPQPKKPTAPQESFKILKQKATTLQRERDEFERRLREIEVAQQMQQSSKPVQQHEEEDIHLGNEELVEGKHLSAYNKKLKKMEQQLQSYQQQAVQQSAEVRLKSQYADFDKVVSRDNIEALRITYPEIAATLSTSTDLYNTGVAAYTMIKKLGLDQQEDYKADVERIQKNAAKPRPLASISPQQGNSPLSQANAFANGLTDELKKQLQQEMINARRAM